MKDIVDILVASQSILNRMDKDDGMALEYLNRNEKELKLSIKKSREPSIYNKYLELHDIIQQSAQEYIITGNMVYKFQPFIYYHNEDFHIEDNVLKLLIKEKLVLFNPNSKRIEIHDELYLEYDQLFEKRNIPIMLKALAHRRDKKSIELLKNYVESLIQLGRNVILNDD